MTALIIVALCVAGIGGVGFCGVMAAAKYVDENRADDLLPTDDAMAVAEAVQDPPRDLRMEAVDLAMWALEFEPGEIR